MTTENQLVERVLENVRQEIRVEVAYALELAFASSAEQAERASSRDGQK